MSKTLLEVFHKYIPSPAESYILGDGVLLRQRADRERGDIEVTAAFSHVVDKKELYIIEDKLKTAYNIRSVRILPRYKSEQFSFDYIPQIISDTERYFSVGRGFFTGYKYKVDGNHVTVEIPFCDGAALLHSDIMCVCIWVKCS